MSKTSPSYIDSHIGYKLKMLRLKTGKSLSDVGDLLGVSFQQIQKYEKGTNKISSSNLYILAEEMNSSVGYFFEGIAQVNADKSYELHETKDSFSYIPPSNISDQELLLLIKYYSKITHSRTRKSVLDLLKNLQGLDYI